MMWAWDLSATLGWAAGGGPCGSWLGRSTPSPWEVRMKPLQDMQHLINKMQQGAPALPGPW